jgi:hypothetical protein
MIGKSRKLQNWSIFLGTPSTPWQALHFYKTVNMALQNDGFSHLPIIECKAFSEKIISGHQLLKNA